MKPEIKKRQDDLLNNKREKKGGHANPTSTSSRGEKGIYQTDASGTTARIEKERGGEASTIQP